LLFDLELLGSSHRLRLRLPTTELRLVVRRPFALFHDYMLSQDEALSSLGQIEQTLPVTALVCVR